MTVKNYVLDINKTSLQHPSIVLRQDDYNIYTVNISVTENGVPVDLGSYTLNFLGITPAGAKIIDSKNFITNAGDLKNGKFSYRFPKEAAGSKGVYDVAYFRLKTTSGATSTIDLNLRVLGGIDVTADEVKDYITVDDILLNTLVAEVFKKVDAKVDQHLATVKKGDKGDTGPAGKDGVSPVIQVNQLFNTEFSPDFQGWTQVSTAYRTTGNTNSGSNVVKVVSDDGDYLYQDVAVSTGVVSFSSIMRVDDGFSGSFRFVINFRDSNHDYITEGGTNWGPNNTSALGYTLQKLENITVPSGAAYVRVSYQFRGTGVARFLQPMLVFSSTVGDYIQGNYYPADTLKNTPRLNGNNLYVGDNSYMGTNTFMDGVSLNGKNKVNDITDTDWLDVPLAEGRTGTVKYKISLGKVFVHLDSITGMTGVGNNAQGQICTLPVNPNPYYIHPISQLSTNIVILTLSPNGTLYIANSMGNTVTETDFLNCDFIVM